MKDEATQRGAIGYSILYVLLGGGILGAIAIFFLARMLGA